MRITFALPELEGLHGGLRVAAQYAAWLSGQGHQVTLAVRRPGTSTGRRLAVRRFLGLVRTAPLPLARGHFAGLDLPVVHLDDTRRVRSRDLPDADVIVSTWWTTAEWADRLSSGKGVHVHFIQGHEVFHEGFRKRVQSVYRQNNFKIVISRWLAHIMKTEYGRRSVLVPNGVQTEQFETPVRNRGQPPRVGFLYSAHPTKNGALAISVLERLHVIRPDILAIFFGTPERPAHLPEWVAYERRPSQERIAAIYASCDLWLFTSRAEGFGLPVLEAMASRTPVIATSAGAVSDLVDGVNGRIVASDPDAFTEAALHLLTGDSDGWRRASEAAWATAQRHSLPTAAAAFEAALLQAVAQARL